MPTPRRIATAGRLAAPALIACIALPPLLASRSADAAPVRMVVPSSPPLWSEFAPTPDEDFGFVVAGVGDVDGDGFGDLLVAAPTWSGGLPYEGRVLLYRGGPAGPEAEPSWILEGRQEEGSLGDAAAGAGDVNGDGLADVLVGEPGFSSGGREHRGRVRLLLGSRRGLEQSAWWDLAGRSENEALGSAVAAAGDVNGDGLADVLIGGAGDTYLQLGRRGTPDRAVSWRGPHAERFCGVGDVNGDGFDDVALSGAGATRLYLGSAGGLGAEPAWSGPSALGFSGGDVNGDGFSDLVLGASTFPGDEVRIFYGSPAGPGAAADWRATEPGRGGVFGASLSANGDLNGDGFADIAVSAPVHEGEAGGVSPRDPSVFVFLGGAAGPRLDPDWQGRGGAVWTFGSSLDLGSDVDGDGVSDLAVGDYAARQDGRSVGEAFLFRLGEGYPVPRIVHEAVQYVAEGTPIVVEATVTDATRRVAGVEVRYRLDEEFDFRPPLAMEPEGENRYRATIPAEDVRGTGLLYSIRATDDYGLAGETILIGTEFIASSAAAAAGLSVRLAATIPGRPDALLFRTRRAGPARVRLYDVRGRLVRTLLDVPALPEGSHRVPLATSAPRPAAGVYFYRVESVEGRSSGRCVLIP